MRVAFHSSFDEHLRALSRAADALADAQNQMASGRRITQMSDDPLGTASAILEHMTVDRLDAYAGAADAAAYRLGLADSVLSDIVHQLIAAQTTALAARGSTRTQTERDAAAQELLAIRNALMSDINTKFQGAYLFSGSNVTMAPYATTASGISAYQGDTDATKIDVGSGRAVASTFDASQIFQGSDPEHVLDTLTSLAAAISAGNDAAVASGVDALSRAFDRATSAQARVGNDMRSLDDSRAELSAAHSAAVVRLSSIEDTNLAEAASKLSQAETAYRAALATIATIGRVSLMDYLK